MQRMARFAWYPEAREPPEVSRRRVSEEPEMFAHDRQPDQERIVAALADEAHVPYRDVAVVYEQVRSGLARGAHVKTFLHILAIRKVRAILRGAAPA